MIVDMHHYNLMKTVLLWLIIIQESFCDQKCDDQNKKFAANLDMKKLMSNYNFYNESKHSIQLTWCGDNKKVLLLVTTEELIFKQQPSSIYRSTDDGRTFVDLTSQLKVAAKETEINIRKDNGLQRNPHDTNIVYVVAHGPFAERNSLLFVTRDGGMSFTNYKIPFLLDGKITFHPQVDHADWLLAHDHGLNALWASADHGTTWTKLHDKVHKYVWGSGKKDDAATVYLSYEVDSIPVFQRIFGKKNKVDRELRRIADFRSPNNFSTLVKNVYSFVAKANFIYVSVYVDQSSDRRNMLVSTDSGSNFDEVQLPAITSDRFYSILDATEGLVFIHVDNPGDTGHGTLYTSAADGVVFSESLRQHLYPNYMSESDFYRVESLVGTFITTVMHEDQSMHSVITHDRGAVWSRLPRPSGGTCVDEKLGCWLQVVNSYAQKRGVQAQSPLSLDNAPGLLLVHGHVASALQTTPPDVFVSSDGGYSWTYALSGPHNLVIADHGGLLVAVPAVNNTPQAAFFSTDEGSCWHRISYAPLLFTGLLSEPGGRAMSVAIWGINSTSSLWTVNTLDFSTVVMRTCDMHDYIAWNTHNGTCVFGHSLSISRLRPGSWCSNGHAHAIVKISEPCPCTPADFECEYGYWRHVESKECVKNPFITNDDICLRRAVYLIKSSGYRKLPDNRCVGGWQPKIPENLVPELQKKCADNVFPTVGNTGNTVTVLPEKNSLMLKKTTSESTKSNGHVLVVLLICAAIVLIILGAVFVYRKRMLRRLGDARFKYSLLRTDNLDNNTCHVLEVDNNDVEYFGSNVSLMNNATGMAQAGGYSGISVQPPPQSQDCLLVDSVHIHGLRSKPHLKSFHEDSDVDMIE